MKLILIPGGPCVCKFAYTLKFICNSNMTSPWWCEGMHRGAKELMPHTYSQQRSNCDFYLPDSGLVNKYPFCGLFTAMFPHFYALCWWVHYFKWPQASCWCAACLKLKNFVMCLTEKTCDSENLPPDMSYSVVDLGFDAYESTIYIK